jgi:hypothetical protein
MLLDCQKEARGGQFPSVELIYFRALPTHSPFAQGLTVYMIDKEGYGLYGGTQGAVSYVVLSAVLFVFTILCYTALSTLGMALRYLVGRLAGDGSPP